MKTVIEEIQKASNYQLIENHLSLPGTDIKQIGDILSDIYLILPKKLEVGYVSFGSYIQAKYIYDQCKNQLIKHNTIKLSGHSLGAGIACIIAILLLLDGYKGQIEINAIGGIKVLSRKTRRYLKDNKVIITWRVRYRDPVPMLGFWLEPIHNTPKEGLKKKWILDYSMKEHIAY